MAKYRPVELVREAVFEGFRVAFLKDGEVLICALEPDGASEGLLRELARFIRESYGEEFVVSNVGGRSALAKVLMVGLDQVSSMMVSDVVSMELEKISSWNLKSKIEELRVKVGAVERKRRRGSRRRKRRRSRRRRK